MKTIYIPDEIHKALKIYCFDKRISMRSKIIELITKEIGYISKEKEEKKIKVVKEDCKKQKEQISQTEMKFEKDDNPIVIKHKLVRKKLYICDHSDENCRERCLHKKEHEAIQDCNNYFQLCAQKNIGCKCVQKNIIEIYVPIFIKERKKLCL